MLKLSKQNSPLKSCQSVAESFTVLMQQHLDYLEHWEAKAHSWEDIEGVHQVRVGLRRMRSAMRLFRPAIPVEVGGPWANEMRELAQMLGPARDMDVFISEGLTAISGHLPLPGEAALRQRAEEKRADAYIMVRQMLDSERYADFKRQFANWLETEAWQQHTSDNLASLSEKHVRRLGKKVDSFARKRLDKQFQRVLQQGSAVDSQSAEQLHDLRIECKKLRYAAEFFTPLFSGMDQFINDLKGLQDLLGVINDAEVTRGLIEQLLEGHTDRDLERYADGVIGWRCCERYQLQLQFNEHWERFKVTKAPW